MSHKGYSLRAIARTLERSPSGLSSEMKKKRKGRRYNAKEAKHITYVRARNGRKTGKKIVLHGALRTFVEYNLMHDQSPEAIAGRLKHVEKNMGTISASAVRRYIKSPYGRRIEAHRIKIFGKKRRKEGRKKRIEGKTMIDKRPKRINVRKGLGHMEGDFIVSGRSGKGLVLSLVDRKVRVTLLEKILPVSVKNVERALVRMKKRYPHIQTITFDNDILFLEHKRLEKILGITIYFARPHTPWDKPSVENGNGVLRRYIPKSSNIANYSRAFIKKIEKKMNNRFMECLGFHTPYEAYVKEKRRHETQKNRQKGRKE